ncbi:hypothetical protein Tco_0588439 [Tanacetum coccineum]
MNQNHFEHNSNYSGFDQPPQYFINHQEDLNQQRISDVHDRWDKLEESYNEIFNMVRSFCEMVIQQKQAANISTHTPEPSRHFNFTCDDDDDDEEYSIPLKDMPQISPSIALAPVSSIMEPEDSLIMRNEELSTIPEKGSDEFIKSSVEDLIPIPREFEDSSSSDSKSILPSSDDFSPIFEEKSMTFSNPLFDSNNDFTSSDDESLSDEDVLEDVKIYSNPLFEFDDEYISSDVNHLFDKVLEDIACKDSYNSNLDESTFLVIPLFDSIKDESLFPFSRDYDTSSDDDDFEDIEYVSLEEVNVVDQEKEEINLEDILQIQDVILREKLLNINRLIDNIESLKDNPTPDRVLKSSSSFPIPVADSDSFFENSDTSLSYSDISLPEFETFSDHTKETRSGKEVDTFPVPEDSIPPGIESDFDLEGDIILLNDLLNDDTILEYERFTFDIEPDAPMINNFNELNKDECFDPGGGEINVFQNVEDGDSFTFVIRTFLPFLTYPVDSPLLLSTGSEDTIFDPRHLYLEPVASHQDGTFICFNVYPNINESPIEIFLFHLLSLRTNEFGDRVKLCNSVTKNKALRGRHPMLILLSYILFLM